MRKVGIFEKKNIIIVGLAIALAASGVGNVLLATRQLQPEITPNKPLVLSANPATLILDPLNAVDFASKLFLEQVVETLFTYNLSSLSLPRIPHLAESYWWENATTLHIKLREGILFHDLTAFNANTTKWNFDRILYLSNCTSLLPSTISLGEYASLYFMPDGVTPIINHVDSNREYNVTIFLNGSYAPFLDLLCHISSAMVSPYSTRDNSYIEPKYERIVGTGPFIYKYFLPRYKSYVAELRLDSFRLYWQEEPFFKEIIVVFYDPTWRCPYIIDYDVDWPTNFLTYDISTIETYDYATVMKFTDIYGLPRLDYQYLGMNNKHISLPWRKAISYAINYTYIIEELLNDFVVRANSPISPGFGDAYNASIGAADYDLIIARQILVDAGIAVGYPINANLSDPYWLTNPLISLNYTYNIGNSIREDIYDALEVWLPAIGIQVIDDGVIWAAFLRKLFEDQDEFHLFWVGWAPDYKDPFNMLDLIFNPTSYANSVQVNDTKLNNLLNLALQTTDDTARNTIYKNIQWYLSNRLFPQCFGYHSKMIYVHKADLHGVQYNALNKVYVYPVYRV